MKKLSTFFITLFIIFTPFWARGVDDLVERVKGKILLRVESKGEAWYVNPDDGKRYYMGRPQDAFELMRTLGLGITDEDLFAVPIREGYYD